MDGVKDPTSSPPNHPPSPFFWESNPASARGYQDWLPVPLPAQVGGVPVQDEPVLAAASLVQGAGNPHYAYLLPANPFVARVNAQGPLQKETPLPTTSPLGVR